MKGTGNKFNEFYARPGRKVDLINMKLVRE